MLVFNGVKGRWVLVYARMCVIGNDNAGLHALLSGISREMINMKFEDQLRGMIRRKHFSMKTGGRRACPRRFFETGLQD